MIELLLRKNLKLGKLKLNLVRVKNLLKFSESYLGTCVCLSQNYRVFIGTS